MTLVADAYFSLAAALASLIAARHPDRERRAAWERAAVTCGVIAASVGCIGIVIGAQRSRRWPGSAGTGHAWERRVCSMPTRTSPSATTGGADERPAVRTRAAPRVEAGVFVRSRPLACGNAGQGPVLGRGAAAGPLQVKQASGRV